MAEHRDNPDQFAPWKAVLSAAKRLGLEEPSLQAKAVAESIVKEHWGKLESLAAELVERRTLSGAEVLDLLGPPPAKPIQ